MQWKIYYFDIKFEASMYILEVKTPEQNKSTKKVLKKEDKELLKKISQKQKERWNLELRSIMH